MRDLIGAYQETSLAMRPGEEAPHRLRDAWEVTVQGIKGIEYGLGVAGAKTLALAGHTVAEFATGGLYDSDYLFNQVKSIQDYWGKDAGAKTTAQSVSFGLTKGLSQFATFGWGGAAAVAGVDRASSEVAEGKTTEQAFALGVLDAAATAIGGAMPAKLPPIGTAAWRTGGRLAAQRVGYGVASNVVPGMVQRYAEGELLTGWGYKEGENIKALDSTAILIDSLMGAAVGGYAHVADRKALQAITEEIAIQRQRLDAEKASANAEEVAKIEAQTRVLDEVETNHVEDVRYLDAKEKAETDILAFMSRTDEEAMKLKPYMDDAVDLPSKLRLIGDEDGAWSLEQFSNKVPPDVLDAAMVENQRLIGVESSNEGKLLNQHEAAKADKAIDDLSRMLDTGEKVDIPELKTTRNIEKEKARAESQQAIEREGAQNIEETDVPPHDWGAQPKQETQRDSEYVTAMRKRVDSLPEVSMKITDDDGNTKTVTKEEYMKHFEERMKMIDDEKDAMDTLAACILR